MAASTIRTLLESLEQVMHDRIKAIVEVLDHTQKQEEMVPISFVSGLMLRIAQAEGAQKELLAKVEALERRQVVNVEVKEELLPKRPLQDLEVTTESLSAASSGSKKVTDYFAKPVAAAVVPDVVVAQKIVTVSADSLVAKSQDDIDVKDAKKSHMTNGIEGGEEVEEEVEEEIEESQIDEADEAEAEAEADIEESEAEEAEEEEGEALELEEFEYKGNTYYRDPDNNVYMADEDGDVNTEQVVGVWNEAKQKILVKKPAA